MTNPRYVPRNFAAAPRVFGRRSEIEWRTPDGGWSHRERAQLDASKLQHQVAFGVLEIFMPNTDRSKVTALAAELGTPYDRLQKMLTGHVVMQLEDIGRLRLLIGGSLDFWLIRGHNAEWIRKVEAEARERREQKLRGAVTTNQKPPMR